MNTAEQTARDEIGQKMSGSFDALACAAVAKSDMLDKHTATIIALTTTVTELTATNKKLVDQLAVALASCARLPPGMGAIPAPTPAPPAPTEITGHTLNSAGIACPATFNPRAKRWYFVTPQECKTCGKKTSHTPENCLELPQNAERKAKMMSRRGKTN
jgi:hypothetical protein